MSENPQEESKKIIIDEDWKSQVEREREEIHTKGEENEEAAVDPQTGIPPASFLMLATTLATQAMASLGQIPDPIEQKPVVNLELAKHYIDTMAVLEEKTKGNLTEEESEMLSTVLYQLRSVFIALENQSTPET
ncbi:MAG: DUF1844 domain-containing protein [Planctomycetaceae bacterium]|nr:DUF1844 domain-containing protein [Planctomycetaceae bacterium]